MAAGVLTSFNLSRAEQLTPSIATSASASTNLLSPSKDDAQIAYVAARALEMNHFRQHRLDNEYSEKFFDRYVEALDPQHLHLTQADLAEFSSFRTNLNNLTTPYRKSQYADTRPDRKSVV